MTVDAIDIRVTAEKVTKIKPISSGPVMGIEVHCGDGHLQRLWANDGRIGPIIPEVGDYYVWAIGMPWFFVRNCDYALFLANAVRVEPAS